MYCSTSSLHPKCIMREQSHWLVQTISFFSFSLMYSACAWNFRVTEHYLLSSTIKNLSYRKCTKNTFWIHLSVKNSSPTMPAQHKSTPHVLYGSFHTGNHNLVVGRGFRVEGHFKEKSAMRLRKVTKIQEIRPWPPSPKKILFFFAQI